MKKTIKTIITLVLLLTLSATLFACEDNNKEEKKENIDITTLELFDEPLQIKELVLEAEKRELSADAQDYLYLLKKNLVKMEIGFAYATKEDLRVEGQMHAVSEKKKKVCRDKISEFTKYQNYDAEDNPMMSYDYYEDIVDGYIYDRYVNGDIVSKTKIKIAGLSSNYQIETGDMGLSYDLIPLENEDFLQTIKKSAVDGKTVFEYSLVHAPQRYEEEKMTTDGKADITVTFDKDGYLVSYTSKSTNTQAFDDGTKYVTKIQSENTFTEMGVAQNISAPEDADTYENVTGGGIGGEIG